MTSQKKNPKLKVDSVAVQDRGGKKVAEVKQGSVTISIFESENRTKYRKKTTGENGEAREEVVVKTYPSFVIPYYEGSTRKSPRRSSLEKATAFAKETAKRLSSTGPKAEVLTEKDRRLYVLAREAVAGMNMDVDEACRRYSELQARLKNGSLERAVDFYNDHGFELQYGVPTTEIYEQYIAHLKKRGAGHYHLRDVERFVGKFVKAIPTSINQITTTQIDKYLENLPGKARSKNNVRDAIIGFFNFAQDKGYLPEGKKHAASKTTEFGNAREEIKNESEALALMAADDIYMPDEMGRLLAAAKEHEPDLLPTIEIKALSGIRTEEVVRLWWVMVFEKEELIRIPDPVGKVDARRVPVLPNLKTRLAAHDAAIKKGRIAVKWKSANSLYHAWKRACQKAGVPYRRNAFRNSYFSYRLVILGGDIHKLAEEGGTSPGELKKNYLSKFPISMELAQQWFSL